MYEQIGNIALLNVKGKNIKEIKKIAKEILKKNKNIKTVLIKEEKFKGRLRKAKYKVIEGEKNFETLYRENGCTFKLNLKDVYFSSRLATNRLWVAKKIFDLIKIKKIKNPKILVCFSGIGIYGIVIAKFLKQNNIDYKITMVEINKKANKYALENISLNKLENIKVLQGDVKKILPQLEKFNFIIMPRPKIGYDFFKEAFINARKGSIIFYFDFINEEEINNEKIKLEEKSKKLNKKIKILEIKKAGQIGVRKWRIVTVFEVK
ncbi:MAG: methyltransferase [Candidatus Pacearchaeota archaeon]